MLGELVATSTADQVRLNGFLMAPGGPRTSAVDGVVILHGLAGNFYSSPLLLNLANRLAQSGLQAVVGNSRGHDVVNWVVKAGRTQTWGSALEDVADGRLDLGGWAEFLVRRGCRKVVLVGHSLGAIKALHAAVNECHPAVVGIAALSPTRLNHQQFLNSRSGPKFRETLSRASAFVAEGRGQELMAIDFPFPTWMTAQAYLDKYGPENRFDWVAWIGRIQLPTFIVFGELELRDNPAFEGLQPTLESVLATQRQIELQILEGADHYYSACVGPVCERVSGWIRQSAS